MNHENQGTFLRSDPNGWKGTRSPRAIGGPFAYTPSTPLPNVFSIFSSSKGMNIHLRTQNINAGDSRAKMFADNTARPVKNITNPTYMGFRL